MAAIRQKCITKKTVDFLGTSDECYKLQGDTHKHLAQKFFSEITGEHPKQIFFFYGEKGMGKSRLAKQTARELAKLVNQVVNDPMLFLFFIKCEKLRGVQGADASEMQSQIAQKIALVDEKLSGVLRNSNIDEFATDLSTGLQNKVFLFLMDGIDPTSKDVMSFLQSLVECNDNVLVLTTSCVHLHLPRLTPKVSTYTCTGLQEYAAIALLREVAGNVDDLEEYQQELVSHCHFNPFLIMTVGQLMNTNTSSTLYSAEEMQELFKHSFSLTVGCDNVPEKDNILGSIRKLAEKISESIGKNLVTVMDQPASFTAKSMARIMRKEKPAVLKKAYLQPLVKHSILRQEDGFFSVNEIFKKYFEDHRVVLNQSQDGFIEDVYKELQTTLRSSLSEQGMLNMVMIHQDDMRKITHLEKRIAEVREPTSTLMHAYQVQLILACEAFLQNIPLGASKVSEFNEQVCVILRKFQAQNTKAFQDVQECTTQQFKQLSITKKGNNNNKTPRRREGGDLKATERRPAPACDPDQRMLERDSAAEYYGKREDLHRLPQNKESLRDRFGLEINTSRLSTFSDFSSLSSADIQDIQLPTEEVGEPPTMPVSTPCPPNPDNQYQLHQKHEANHYVLPQNQSSFQPSQPQEDSFHGDSLNFILPNETQAEEQSFHDWQSLTDCAWSMEVNPPSPNSRN